MDNVIAIFPDAWTYHGQYSTGIEVPGVMPIEELPFFVVIPICGLLAYHAVSTILTWVPRMLTRAEHAG